MDFSCAKLIDDFIQERRYVKGVTPATLDWYKYSFRPVAERLSGCHNEQDVKLALKAAVTEMMAAGKNPISVNDRIRCWNAWLNWLHQEGFTTQHLRLPHLKEPQKIVPTLTPEESQRLIRYRPRQYRERRAHALACVVLDCGLRVAEGLGLAVADVDLENLLIHVRQGKGRKERVVPISVAARKVLWPWLKERTPDALIFCNSQGRPLDHRDALRDLKILFGRVSITRPRLAWHALRHTFAVNYIRAGGSVFHLQRVLGHASLEMTRRYVNLETSDLQSVHQRLSVLARVARVKG